MDEKKRNLMKSHFQNATFHIKHRLSDWHSFNYKAKDENECFVFSLNVYGSNIPSSIESNMTLKENYIRAALPSIYHHEFLAGSKWLTEFTKIEYQEEEVKFKGLFEAFVINSYIVQEPAPLVLTYDDISGKRSCPIYPSFNGKKNHGFLWNDFWTTEKVSNLFAKDRIWPNLVKDSDIIVIVPTLTSKLLNEIVHHIWEKLHIPTYNDYPQRPLLAIQYREWCEEVHEYYRYEGYGFFPNVAIFSIDTILDDEDMEKYCNSEDVKSLEHAFKCQASRKSRKIEAEIAKIQEAKRIKDLHEYNILHAHMRDKKVTMQSNGFATFSGLNYDYPPTILNPFFPTYKMNDIAREVGEMRGVSILDIKSEWEKKSEETIAREKLLRDNIEKWFTGSDVTIDNTFVHFKQFQEHTGLWPYRTSWTVYDEDYKIASIVDLIELKEGKFYLYKIKSSDNILEGGIPKKFDDRMGVGKFPVKHLGNTSYSKWALEINLTKFILERNYGITIEDLRLGVFHPSYNKPYVIRIPDLQEEIKNILDSRSEILF